MDESKYIKTPVGLTVNFIPSVAVALVDATTAAFTTGLLYIGTGGDLKVMPYGLETYVTFKNVPDGSFLPFYVKGIHEDTTATDVLVCY